MRGLIAAVTLPFLLGACAEPTSTFSFAPSVGRAYFDSFPELLYEAASRACSSPADTIIRPSRNELRCEALPTPDAAAGLILAHNGVIEDLPRYVMSYVSEPSGDGYVTTVDFHVRIPQRDGSTKILRINDTGIDRRLDQLITVAGGQPVPIEPEGDGA